MASEGLRAQLDCRNKPRFRGGPVGAVDNVPGRAFTPASSNTVWVTDITFIRTYEGWLFPAVVMKLYSRQTIGCSARPTMTTGLVLQGLLASVPRRKPATVVEVHSDQASEFTGGDWYSFLKSHHMKPCMSRRCNCHDNAVVESFFGELKRERNKGRVYPTRAVAGSGVFDCIESNTTRPDDMIPLASYCQ